MLYLAKLSQVEWQILEVFGQVNDYHLNYREPRLLGGQEWKPGNQLIMLKGRDDGSLDLSCVEYGKQMNETCVLEIDSTGHANRGLMEKEESVMSPTFFR